MDTKGQIAIGSLGLFSLALPTQADLLKGPLYVTPMAHYVTADDSERDGIDNSLGWQLNLGGAISRHLNLELKAFNVSFDIDNAGATGEYKRTGLGLDLSYFFERNPFFNPYVSAGLAAVNTELSGIGESSNAYLDLGLGFTRKLSNNGVMLRAEARYAFDFFESDASNDTVDFQDVVLNVGISIPLWQGSPYQRPTRPATQTSPYVYRRDNPPTTYQPPAVAVAPPPVAAPPATAWAPAPAQPTWVRPQVVQPATQWQPPQYAGWGPAPVATVRRVAQYGYDQDRDGVPDSVDKCPVSSIGERVNQQGCSWDVDYDDVPDYRDRCPNTPRYAEVTELGCPLDDDLDGVANFGDRCPNTPEDAKVDRYGCELDQDQDGLANGEDRCQNTPPGQPIDPEGCLVRPLTISDALFDTNKAVLKPGSLAQLDQLAFLLKQRSYLKLRVIGNADSRSSKPYNQALSERRHDAIVNYLVSKGVPAARLIYWGEGEEAPIASNKTKQGRQQNRRADVRIFQRGLETDAGPALSAQAKARIALEALQDPRKLNTLAQRYGVSVTDIRQWQQTLLNAMTPNTVGQTPPAKQWTQPH